MKKILMLSTILIASAISAQSNCPAPKEENYRKVMNSAFAKDYKDCPVTITGEFLKEGYLNGWRKPSKLNKMVFFQCLADGDHPQTAPLTNEESGDFFVVDKANADLVLSLKRGDKVKMTGKTFTQNFYGAKLSTFFIVEKIEKY